MIAKHISINSVKRSSFAGLVNYMVDPQQQTERVGTIQATNCHSDRVDAVIAEVLNTQQMNKRALSDKTYHLVISFRPEDQPTNKVLQAIESELCDGLGFNGHQRISVVHHDTDHLHVHVAINKIHPERLTIHNPHYDYKVIGEWCKKLEQQYGLTPDNHEVKQRGAQSAAANIEFNAGETSLIGWIKQECLAQIKAAGSWAALHQVLKDHSLELRERGNGFVFVSSNDVAVKVSSVDRALSKKRLIDRLGAFVPAIAGQTTAQSKRKQYQKRPVQGRMDTTVLYLTYTGQQREADQARTSQWRSARDNKHKAIESAKHQARLKRVVIKNLQGAGLSKRILYRAVHQTLCNRIQQINQAYREDYQAIKNSNRKLGWLDWLSWQAKQGNAEALAALRSRAARSTAGNAIVGNNQQAPFVPSDAIETITKTGTVIVKVGSATVRDDGQRLLVPDKTTQDELHDVLHFAVRKYGNTLAINGTDAFRHQVVQAAVAAVAAGLDITFDDEDLEQRRQALIQPTISNGLTIGKAKVQQAGAVKQTARKGRAR